MILNKVFNLKCKDILYEEKINWTKITYMKYKNCFFFLDIWRKIVDFKEAIASLCPITTYVTGLDQESIDSTRAILDQVWVHLLIKVHIGHNSGGKNLILQNIKKS